MSTSEATAKVQELAVAYRAEAPERRLYELQLKLDATEVERDEAIKRAVNLYDETRKFFRGVETVALSIVALMLLFAGGRRLESDEYFAAAMYFGSVVGLYLWVKYSWLRGR